MKKTLQILTAFLLFCLATSAALAQTPDAFNYQAVARDNTGALIKNQNVTVKTIILSGPGASNKIYEETHVVTTNDFGHFSVIVGKGSTSDNFSSIDWSSAAHHLKVELDEGAGFAVMGTVQLQSVPYALHSKTAETVNNLTVSTTDISDINGAGAANGDILKWNGTAWVPGSDNIGATDKIDGKDVDASNPSTNDILKWNGTAWVLSADEVGPTDKIDGKEVDAANPAMDNILKWNGTMWVPATDNTNTYYAGQGLVQVSDSFQARFNNPMWNANKLNNIDIATGTPSMNDVLQYDGTKWGFAAVSGGSGSSVWTKSGNDIYFNDGLVGINHNSPASRLSVRDTLTGTGNGFFIMTDKYFNAASGTGARYTASRNVVIGDGGLSNIAALNVVGGDVATSGGEAIATLSDVSATGAYNIANFSTVSAGATAQSVGYLANVKGRSSNNLGVYSLSTATNTGTNYGIFAAADSATTNYAGYFAGDVAYTGTLTGPSDAKLKYNVESLTGATDLIKRLQPRTYLYKQEGEAAQMNLSEGKQYGFIAQELEKVIPELVLEQKQVKGPKEEGNIEYKAVNYISLIPVLTQALKEQQEVIEKLEKRIAELEAN